MKKRDQLARSRLPLIRYSYFKVYRKMGEDIHNLRVIRSRYCRFPVYYMVYYTGYNNDISKCSVRGTLYVVEM